ALGSGGEETVPLLLAGSKLSKLAEEVLEAAGRLLSPALADRERLLRLAVAVDDHVGDLLDLGVADPLADRLVRVVDLDAVRDLRGQRTGGLAMVLAHGNHADLDGREPERERAGVVLDQDADEALE